MKYAIFITLLFIFVFAGHHKKNKESENIRTGDFTVSIKNKEIKKRTLNAIYRKWKKKKKPFSLEQISYFISVPKDYNPEKPAGILYYISHLSHGKFPHPSWKESTKENNLIFMTLNQKSRDISQQELHLIVIEGIKRIMNQYKINKKRIYLSGYRGISLDDNGLSGGGAVDASSTSILSSDIINGSIFIDGAGTWEKLPVPNKPNFFWYSFFGKFGEEKRVSGLSRAKKYGYVFMFDAPQKGSFFGNYMHATLKNYKKNSFRFVKHISHSGIPNKDTLNEAIHFLDTKGKMRKK